jgi:hypothetical protein
MDILGIPYLAWGIGGLVIAGLWVFIWPKKENVRKNSLPYFILRWFHTLVWLFLSAAGFLSGLDILGGKNTAHWIVLLALITYLVFMAAVVTTQ